MSSDHALPVVRRYHDGWTSGNYEEATGLLAPDLVIEVPINEYPTSGSFAQAVIGIGARLKSVKLLSELANDGEAMLLYDLDVEGLGELRIAEHFTVEDGRITRIRQIHDTTAVRAAGLG